MDNSNRFNCKWMLMKYVKKKIKDLHTNALLVWQACDIDRKVGIDNVARAHILHLLLTP